MKFLSNKNMVGAVVAVAVVALSYYLWTSASDTPLLTTTEETSPLSQEILTTLGQLNTLQLDPALFKDPVFMSLSDFGSEIPPQSAGRRNPFAPIGSSATQTASPAPAAL